MPRRRRTKATSTAKKRSLSPSSRRESEGKQPEPKIARPSTAVSEDEDSSYQLEQQPQQQQRRSSRRTNAKGLESQQMGHEEPEVSTQIHRRRFRPGTRTLQEIRKYQKGFGFLIPKLPFVNVVREVAQEMSIQVLRWEARALEAIQEAAEAFLVHVLEDSYLCALHARRVTLTVRDIRLARRIGGYGL